MARRLGILLVLSLFVCAGVWLFYDRVQTRMTSFTQVPAATVEPDGENQVPPSGTEIQIRDYTVIVSRNIFQAVADVATGEDVPVIDEEALEETKLKLVLLGTVTGTEDDARAIIVDQKERKQQLYRIGDLVQNGRIRKISRGRVVLEVEGRNEILQIKDREGGGPGTVQPPVAATPAVQLPGVGQPVAPVVRPRRRISLRQTRQVTPVEVAEPEEPLGEVADEINLEPEGQQEPEAGSGEEAPDEAEPERQEDEQAEERY